MASQNNKKLLKERSRSLIIKALLSRPELRRQDLAQITMLSLPAVTKIVQELLDEGILRETESPEPTGGRRPGIISTNPDFGDILAMDLEADSLKMIITNFRHEKVAEETVSADFRKMSEDDLHSFLKNSASLFMGKNKKAASRIKCVGLAMTGYADADGNVVSSSLGNLRRLDTKKILPNIPVFVENNANAEAIREHTLGMARGKTDFLCLSILKNGIGAGVFLNGRLHTGAGGMAGEYGGAMRLWDDTAASRGIDSFIRVSANVAYMAYNLLNLQRIYVCCETTGLSGQIMAEMDRVFHGHMDKTPVDISESGPYGVCLGAAVLARERFLGHVEFQGDQDIWKRISQREQTY